MPTIPGFHVQCGDSHGGRYMTGTTIGTDCTLVGKNANHIAGSNTPPTERNHFWEWAEGWTIDLPGFQLTSGKYGALWVKD